MKNPTSKEPKPLDLKRLRHDLELIMREIDRTHGVLPDYYSPVMWQRLQHTAEKVADAIQAVRMKLANPKMSCQDIADKLGLERQQVAGYLAWNTMLDPKWVKPAIAAATVACPFCGAQKGEGCNGGGMRIHKKRRQAYINAGRPEARGAVA